MRLRKTMDKVTELMSALDQWIDAKIADELALRNNDGFDSCVGLSSGSKYYEVEKVLHLVFDEKKK